ncbi:hypothetical protein CK203_067278 [Vitis vinifera]|uniref:Uncharacterized protein n=1 Tax=Vitis vinifera TaxID=29760 RepID=A0A438EFH9_VITVI|nr:hypothetical protein CK203_067278 [Vitis vinifera]
MLSVGRVENVELLAFELGCKVGALPSTYLGLLLGASHKLMVVWDGVEERMWKRLALWKKQFISKEGKITFIRNTLVNMPIYLMKFGEESGGWSSREVREGYGVGFWKEIRKEADSKNAWIADCWDSLGEDGG